MLPVSRLAWTRTTTQNIEAQASASARGARRTQKLSSRMLERQRHHESRDGGSQRRRHNDALPAPGRKGRRTQADGAEHQEDRLQEAAEGRNECECTLG